jgi:putative ABC transport system permease protein
MTAEGTTRLQPRRGRWRVALRYASRDARRHKGRTALVAIMVALPSGLGAAVAVLVSSTADSPAALVSGALGNDASVQARIDLASPVAAYQAPDASQYGSDADAASLPADLFENGASPRDPDDWSTYPPLDAAAYDRALAASLPGGDRLVPVASGWVSVRAEGATLRTGATGYQLDTSGVAARAFGLAGTLGAGEVALSRDDARDLHVGVGDQVRVSVERDSTDPSVYVYDGDGAFTDLGSAGSTDERTFTVARLLDKNAAGAAVFSPDGPLPVTGTYSIWGAQGASTSGPAWLVTGPAPVTWDDVQAVNRLGSAVVSRDVVLHTPADAVAQFEAENGSDGSSTVTAQTASLFGGAIVLGLLQAILMIGPAFQVGARRASRDLALLAAAGADSRTVRRTVLAGGLVVGTVASVAATTLGSAAAAVSLRVWSTDQVQVPWPWLGGFAAVGTFIAVAAAWLPARRAARTDPVLVLAGRRADAPPRRWPPIAGAVLGLTGTLVALAGAATNQSVTVLVAGIVLAEVGLVIASGSIVGGLARLAGRFRGTTRLALRDAARHRTRTAPAVAAVLAACAAATAGLVFAGSQAQHDRLSYMPDAATGTFLVGALADPAHGLTTAQTDTVTSVVEKADVTTGALVPVTAVLGDGDNSTPVWVAPRDQTGWISSPASTALGTVVDDGSSLDRLELLGVPDPGQVAAALRAGRVVVGANDLRDDGTAELVVEDSKSTDGGTRTVHVAATAVGGPLQPPTNLPLIPPSVADRLHLATRTSALVARVRPGAWDDAVRTTLDDALVAAVPASVKTDDGERHATASAYVEPGRAPWTGGQGLAELLIVAGALVVALAAAWIATALAGTESLPDLATLQAVGAPPRTRRRFAAAQSAVITVTGAVLGAATGLVIGATVVLAEREQGVTPDLLWMVDVPWAWVAGLVVAIPLLGAAAAWLVTRSRLPLSRRLDR